MIRILNKTNDQRSPYITRGEQWQMEIRICCLEKMISLEMNYLVFPADASMIGTIRQFVDLQDNAEDFSSDYPW